MLNIFLLFTALLVSTVVGTENVNASDSAITNSETIQTTFVSSEGAELFCRSIGKGKALIVVHGGPGLTQDYLLPQMYELAKNNFVIFYDQRGCGKSTGDINRDTISIESFVNDIEAIRKAFKLDKISLLGHSWGGFLAIQYTISHQEHVEKLIVSNSAPVNSEGYALFEQEYIRRMNPYQESLKKISNTQKFRDGAPDVTEQHYRIIVRQYCYNPEKADLLNFCMTSTVFLNGQKVGDIIRERLLDKPYNLNSALNGLKTPTLVLHGDVDPIPKITAQNIHENIPGSQYILMKNCGHFPYVELPKSYFNHINRFLNNDM